MSSGLVHWAAKRAGKGKHTTRASLSSAVPGASIPELIFRVPHPIASPVCTAWESGIHAASYSTVCSSQKSRGSEGLALSYPVPVLPSPLPLGFICANKEHPSWEIRRVTPAWLPAILAHEASIVSGGLNCSRYRGRGTERQKGWDGE